MDFDDCPFGGSSAPASSVVVVAKSEATPKKAKTRPKNKSKTGSEQIVISAQVLVFHDNADDPFAGGTTYHN